MKKKYIYDFDEKIAKELDSFDINILLDMVDKNFNNEIVQIIS